ncbi:TIGR02117 family protein [Weeksellaceae bacterium TAE3-ERU29]|nr:TIGR02117 family protein [Weeksellaceae bacterium TAE3-ERU29]
MKKIFKYILYTIGSFIALVICYLLAAFIFSNITVNKDFQLTEEVSIYLLSNGVHSDIVVPVKNEIYNWETIISPKDTKGNEQEFEYVALGWGDRGFYLEIPTWADLTPKIALKAGLGLSTTAIHATFYHQLEENEDCIKINISKEEYQKLVNNILRYFKTKENKAILIETDANYGLTDAFYEAEKRYHIFYTCNTWANDMFKKSGLKACLWTPFSKDILNIYQVKSK